MFKNIIDIQDKASLNQAIGLHLVLLLISLTAPDIFNHRPNLPEVYTVNLFRVADLPEQQPAANEAVGPMEKEAATVPKPEIEPVSSESAIVAPMPSAVPAEIISIKPLRQKIKKTEPPVAVAPVDRRELEKLRRQRALTRIRAEQNLKAAEKKAAVAASSAVDKLRQSLQTAATAKTDGGTEAAQPSDSPATAAVDGGPPTNSPGIEVDEAMKHYYSAVYQRIHRQWILPDLQNWDSGLQGIVIITVRRNGTIINSRFESESSNNYFNQSLLKAVRAAEPLPPFPEEFKQQHLEIGLRFRLQDML